jgi:heat-inducible transcriptional repressor
MNDSPKLPEAGLLGLDQRARDIFRNIVESYLDTGDPVGSRSISRRLPVNLSPASVRNVMSDLEQLGLIFSPHTSAGRIPTELGLRFFIDALLEIGDLSAEERRNIEAQIKAKEPGRSVEDLLSEASRSLSGLSRGAGIVLAGKTDLRLKHVEFVRLEPGRALVVLVDESGSVENRLIDIDPGTTPSSLVEASNYLNNALRGHTLSEAKAEIERNRAKVQAELDQLAAKLVDEGIASWASASSDRPETLIVRGQRELISLLARAETGDGVRIFVGSESKLFSLSGSSLVVSPFHDSDQRIVGALGVIGPTRLNYARIVPMVDYTAKLVSRLIS